MGIKVGRIVEEFVFKSLIDHEIEIEIHGHKKDLACKIKAVEEDVITMEVVRGEADKIQEGEDIRVFVFFQNNYHTFDSTVLEKSENLLKISHPEGVYKNPERKHERIRLQKPIEVSFILKGKKVELNFPKSSRFFYVGEPEIPEDFDFSTIPELLKSFREKMSAIVSDHRITMFRDKIPTSYEEKVMAAMGKILWLPSTEEDFPFIDPFPEERIITKRELVKYEESFETPAHIIISKLENLIFTKQKNKIFSEAYCPIIYNEYLIGYIYLANKDEKKEKISGELLDYVYQFSQILSYSLKRHDYFSTQTGEEHRYDAQIIDISASGLLFTYPSGDLIKDLVLHTDLNLTIKFADRTMVVGSRVRRKFGDKGQTYFGVQFLKIEPDDFRYIFEMLYGRPYTTKEEDKWEGGAPPPPLDLFGE